jgi:hypothetical protein
MEYIQQQMFLTKDNKLIFRENAECILIFVEGKMYEPYTCNEYVQMFIDRIGVDTDNCDFMRVTNEYGYKHAVDAVDYCKKNCLAAGRTLVLITNMTAFLYSGLYNTWNSEQEKFLTYIVDNQGTYHWIHDLTERELRAGHNLENIYRNGGFDLDECD